MMRSRGSTCTVCARGAFGPVRAPLVVQEQQQREEETSERRLTYATLVGYQTEWAAGASQ